MNQNSFGAQTNSSPELPDDDETPKSERDSEDMILDEMVEDIPCTD